MFRSMCVKLDFQNLILIVDCLHFFQGRGGGVVVWYLPEYDGKYSIKSKWRSKVCVKLTPLMTFSHKQSFNGFRNLLFI